VLLAFQTVVNVAQRERGDFVILTGEGQPCLTAAPTQD
jgi:hypothetical protein